MVKLEYCEYHNYYNYLDDRWFGGGTIYTKMFQSMQECDDYIKRYSYMWDKCKAFNNRTHRITTEL